MNKAFKSVEEVKKYLDSVSLGPASVDTQPEGSVWHPQRKFDILVKPTSRTPEETKKGFEIQKKQMEQYPGAAALANMRIGSSLVFAEADPVLFSTFSNVAKKLRAKEQISPGALNGGLWRGDGWAVCLKNSNPFWQVSLYFIDETAHEKNSMVIREFHCIGKPQMRPKLVPMDSGELLYTWKLAKSPA